MKTIIYMLIVSMALSMGCTKVKKPQSAIEREKWIESFNDSITYYELKNEKVNHELSVINNRITSILNDFEYVNNPRQVTGFYILKGWNSKLPFSNTAIYARITDAENLELIATLKGGNFNKITVEAGSEKVSSSIVPYDQALNYRYNGLNTVCFTGTKADSVAEFIASHHSDNNLKVVFSEGKYNKSFTLPTDQRQMITQTWNLYSTKLSLRDLQKELWINSRKIQAYLRMLESRDSASSIKY